MVIRFIIEGLLCVAFITGFCFEDRIAKWERKKLRKVLKNKKLGKKLESNGIYPYDIREAKLYEK